MADELTENLIRNLPDPEAARRFLGEVASRFPSEERKLAGNAGLRADVLTIVAFSPLLATTLLQNKSYFSWLDRQRTSSKVRGKEDLLESLARFALTNSTLETNVLLSRFRRRELLRIYLQDVRDLETIAEVTEDISNLADAILEHALRIARQELDNRYGAPLETDGKGRSAEARFCIVALGKLGSRELNYASDIDLLFLYSSEGATSGNGTRGSVTNREYFVKLAEHVIKLVGQQTGEGAAYRVDMRLRPHGRVGALAITVNDAAQYYTGGGAQPWERQVLIRSRASAGDADLFKDFAERVAPSVFPKGESVSEALRNVRLSKEKINLEKQSASGFDVKLGIGGIREIEFIAQALQLAHGGEDEWLRASHTLISLSRLADRGLISETEHAELADAYGFLRRLEHRLQMEHGLQTHLIPNEPDRRLLAARRMGFDDLKGFDAALGQRTESVSRAFRRIFGEAAEIPDSAAAESDPQRYEAHRPPEPAFDAARSSLAKSGVGTDPETLGLLRELAAVSPNFAGVVAANPELADVLVPAAAEFPARDYAFELAAAVGDESGFAGRIARLRRTHSRLMLEIAVSEVFGQLSVSGSKQALTDLAEASIAAALRVTYDEIGGAFANEPASFPFAVLALGKLGGRSMDYGSDLDLVLVYDDQLPPELIASEITPAAYFAKATEIFVTALSAMTREGSIYRVDLRLRPDGKNGAPANPRKAFLEYFEKRAAAWEFLAYVKLRGVAGNPALAESVAAETRRIIHRRALELDREELRRETLRVREALELQKTRSSRRETDIKYGAGGMLDVYFAMRYLQLRDDVPDDPSERSTLSMLKRLAESGSLKRSDYDAFSEGYGFLSELDHELRLTIGRSTRFPAANREILAVIAHRMELSPAAELEQTLAHHRLSIRSAFENVLAL